jgi:hypothetical protein
MIRKLLLVVGCLAVAFVAWSGWTAHQNKQRFDAVMADYAKDQPNHR